MIAQIDQRIREARENESGFTLVELLLVIVILGVLAGIVVFSVQGINDNSKSAACKTDVSTVQSAEEAYYANANPHAYTAHVTDLVTANLLKSAPSDVNDNVGANGLITGIGC